MERRPDPTPLPCPRCAALPEDRYQEYCLECGARLPRYGRPALLRRDTWWRESPALVLLAFLLIALISTAIVAAASARGGDGEPGPSVAAGPTTSTLEILTDATTATVPPAATTFTFPTTTFGSTFGTTRGARTGAMSTGRATGVMSWPAGDHGYTIVLASVVKSRGESAAEAEARDAVDAGLPDVGVLDSDDYSSLRGGYWVVFTGVYDAKREAEARRAAARSAGYRLAYVREVRP